MNRKLIELWQRAMQNKHLDSDTRSHIERVLNAEYCALQRATGTERHPHDHQRQAA